MVMVGVDDSSLWVVSCALSRMALCECQWPRGTSSSANYWFTHGGLAITASQRLSLFRLNK